MLADDQIERYSRQILLREIGASGQERLIGSSVAIAGCGSLAHLSALYLAGAGIGHIRLLASEADPVGAADALADDLSSLNPEVRVETLSIQSFLASGTSHRVDVLIDTGARLPTLAAAAATSSNGCTVLAAAVRGSHGWLARHGSGICIGCVALHEGTAADVLDGEPSATGVLASLLAFETLAAVLGWEDDGRSGWRHYDGTTMSLSNVRFTARADCTVCGGAS
jgi:molybdopterin/thiamine biosynthesis adenylyltransferase